jgi:succinate dehydrogenase / fumarate reductase flavoprotein subunit
MYHGANRLGGNSLLAAIYSGHVAASSIGDLTENKNHPDFEEYIADQKHILDEQLSSKSKFSAVYVRQEIAKLLNDCLGITRTEEKLVDGIQSVDYYLSISDKLAYDSDVSPYIGYSLRPMLLLARAILTSALARKETRGAHIRNDYPSRSDEFAFSSICEYQNGEHRITYIKEDEL